MTDPHLDDEQLSLLLDGVDVDGRAHVEDGSCASCADRLASLRSARDALAAAVVDPLPADVLDRLVAAAVDAPPAVADVVALSAGASGLGRRRRRVTTPPPAWLVGAAAGIAALVGVAGVLRAVDVAGSGGDDAGLAITADEESGAEAAIRGVPMAGTATAGSGAGGATGATTDPEVVVADLADQSDPATLTRALEGLGMRTTPAAGLSTTSDFGAKEAAPTADAAGDTRSPAAAAAPPATTVPADRAQCRARADAIGAGRFGELLSTATLRWNGRPAEVLVFRLAEPSTADEPATRQALVLSRPGCELLADPRF